MLGKASKSSCSNFPGLLIDWSQTAHPSPLIPPTEGTVASFRLKKQITPATNQSLLRKKPLHQAQWQLGEDKAPSLAIERQLPASSNAGRQHLGFGLSWSERQHLLKPLLPSGHRQVPAPPSWGPKPPPHAHPPPPQRPGETQGVAATSPLTARCLQHPCLQEPGLSSLKPIWMETEPSGAQVPGNHCNAMGRSPQSKRHRGAAAREMNGRQTDRWTD